MARKRGQRGPGKDRGERIGGLLDKAMLAVLQEGGEPILDKAGNVQLDGDGKVVRRRISAATLNAIRARLKDVGANTRRTLSPHEELVRGAMDRGLDYPESGAEPAGPLPFPFTNKPVDPFPVPSVSP